MVFSTRFDTRTPSFLYFGMLKKDFLREIVIFIVVVIFLLIVIPVISSLLKQLLVLQAVIAIGGAILLRLLINRIKGKKQLIRTKEISTSPDLHFPEIISIKPFTKDGIQYYEYECKTWFDRYERPIDSFRAYVDFIKSNPRYSKALEQTNAEDYLREIARAGYATGINYEETLLNVLKSVTRNGFFLLFILVLFIAGCATFPHAPPGAPTMAMEASALVFSQDGNTLAVGKGY